MPRPEIDRTIVGWRAWYAGGRVYDSTQMEWSELPEHGVLIVILYYKTRWYSRTMSGSSIYWREDTPQGPIYAHNEAADAIISAEARERNYVKFGKWVTDEELNLSRLASDALRRIAPDESLREERV